MRIPLPDRGYDFMAAVESVQGLKHVIEYARVFPEERAKLVDIGIIRYARKLEKLGLVKNPEYSPLINEVEKILGITPDSELPRT